MYIVCVYVYRKSFHFVKMMLYYVVYVGHHKLDVLQLLLKISFFTSEVNSFFGSNHE